MKRKCTVVMFVMVFVTFTSLAQRSMQEQLLDSAWKAYELGALRQAHGLNKLGIRASRLSGDLKTEAQCMINNGTIAFVEGHMNDAYAYYDSSWQLYRRLEDTVQIVNALRNMALASRKLSLYGQGILHCTAALDLLKQPGREKQRAQVLNTLATLFESTNNIQQSKKALLQALPLTDNQGSVYTNLGNTYFKIYDMDSTIYCYLNALRLSNDSLQYALILNNLGESYIESDSLGKAYTALQQSLVIRKKKDPLALVSTYNNLAKLFIRQEKVHNADHYLLLVSDELSRLPNERETLKFFGLRKQYYKNAGDFENAIRFDSMYDSLNSKLFEEERIKVSELQAAYELSERDRKLSENEQVLALRVAEVKQKTFLNRMALIVMFVLTSASLLLFYLYRVNERLKRRNEILIHEQNHRVKNNLQMIASLLGVQSSAQSDSSLKAVLAQNETRIQSIALLHRMLYSSTVSSDIALKEYVNDLITELKYALGVPDAPFDITCKIEKLSIGQTVSIGLILNELVTNSVKHAALQHVLQVSVVLTRSDDMVELIYTDNGHNFQPQRFQTSKQFGVQLITLQAKQLKGRYTLTNKDGFHFVLVFPFT